MKRLALIALALSMFMAVTVFGCVLNDHFHRGPYRHHWR